MTIGPTGPGARLVAGFGARTGVTVADVTQALATALARAGLGREALTMLAAPAARGGEPAFAAAAAEAGLALVLVPQDRLAAAADRTLTYSSRSVTALGVPSAAEAAALAAAGPRSRLLGPRVAVGGATCALAAGE